MRRLLADRIGALPAWLLAAAVVLALGGPGRYAHELWAHAGSATHAAAACAVAAHSDPAPHDEPSRDDTDACAVCVVLASTRGDLPAAAVTPPPVEALPVVPRTADVSAPQTARSAAAARGPPVRLRSAAA